NALTCHRASEQSRRHWRINVDVELLHQSRRQESSTAYPPTRTFVTQPSSLVARTKISLGLRASTPCQMSTCSPQLTMPYFAIHAATQPAADPVAGSSPP